MNKRAFVPAFTILAALLLIAGLVSGFAPRAGAADPGTIKVTKSWAQGQEPKETVEVCFVVTSDADGTDVLGRKCTTDATYTVTFGPSDPALTANTTYFVWEEVGAGWTTSGDNPVEVKIPSAGGNVDASFENEKSNGTATITIHKATCPESSEHLFDQCHDDRLADIHFTIGSDRVTTDKDGVATAKAPSGSVRITEAEGDFTANATAGAAYVYCSVQPGSSDVLHDAVANHRSVDLIVKDGQTIVCDWYNLTAKAGAKTGILELHKRVCPNGPPAGDIFLACHDNLPQQPVAFSVGGGAAKFVGTDGNVIFDNLPAGTQQVQETEGPPLEAVELRIWCSVQGSNSAPFQVQPNGPNFAVAVDAGTHVICDVYNIAINLSGQTPTPLPQATNTPTVAPPPVTNSPTIAPPPPPTATMTPIPPTATMTPIPPTATMTPTMTATPLPPTPTPIVSGRPIQVQAGTCNDLADQPSFPLNDLITPEGAVRGSERATVAEASYSQIDISFTDLLSTNYAITVRKSHESNRTLVACGEIGGPIRSDGSVVVGLRELANSGLTGVAYVIPDPNNAGRTRVSIFLAPGLAEEDPTLKPASAEALVIDSKVDNGPVSPESQSGYEIKIFGSGRAEIVITPPGAADALGNKKTAQQETRTVDLSDAELTRLLQRLQNAGYFQLTQADKVNPDNQTVGGGTSVLTVSLVDGEWTVNANGLTQAEASTLDRAQKIISDAVGGVELP
jgi:hypothetical protein